MILQALRHAVPPQSLTQSETLDLVRESGVTRRLSSRSMRILESVLLGPTGIDKRHCAASDPAEVFTLDAGGLNQYYEKHAPALAASALNGAMADAGVATEELDALFLCSCTGYLCPGPTSYVAEQLGLRTDCVLHDVIGLGCGAAIPTLRAACAHLAANPDDNVAVVAVEICSAAFYLDDDPGVLISFCLFGDAASASIWSNDPSGINGRPLHLDQFRSLHYPEHRQKIRFENRHGFLRNLLDRSVPAIASVAVHELMAGTHAESVLISHPGGRDVMDAIQVECAGQSLDASRETMRRYGNCSSPSVLIALELDLASNPSTDHRMLTAFGAGFSCHGARLSSAK